MPALPAIELRREEISMNKTLIKKTRWVAVAVGAVALLAACGGGSDHSGPALVMGTDVPVTVEQSASGVIDFAKAQLLTTSETSEPLLLGDAKLATDDSAEPADI